MKEQTLTPDVSKPNEGRGRTCVSASQCLNRKRIYLDTETMGLVGIPFLVQYKIDAGDIQLFHVLDHTPQESIDLVNMLCSPDAELVAYNATFDIKMLSKLATVASMVGNSWSFDAVWYAERIWRGEVSYTNRLKCLRLAYPDHVTDLMIAAQSLPPLEEQFLSPPRFVLSKFPIAAVPEFDKVLRQALHNQSFYTSSIKPCLDDRMQVRIDGANTRGGRDRIRKIQKTGDYNCLDEVTVSFNTDGVYSLKNVARVLGFKGEITEFEFLDDFGKIPESYCPTYLDHDLYKALYAYVYKHAHDEGFLNYARRDIEMLAFLDQHYRPLPGFTSLRHDYDLASLIANLELYGVHIDTDRMNKTIDWYGKRIQESAVILRNAGLVNYNSSDQVVSFVNRQLFTNKEIEQLDVYDAIGDMQKDTLLDLLKKVSDKGKSPNATVAGLLKHLIRARTYSKRPEFFKHAVGDTMYPQFRIRGAVTDRMTSSRPSIQNIPSRATDEERDEAVEFRTPFTPPAGYHMLAGDADQFEMRLVAAEAKEQSLIQAFRDGVDPHSLTAQKALGQQIRQAVPSLAQVDDDQLLALLNAKDPRVKSYRGRAKILNFATIYGASAYGISAQAGTSTQEAQQMLDAFFQSYPAIDAAIKHTHGQISIARRNSIGLYNRQKPQSTRIANRVGVTRSFELALRLIDILLKLCEPGNLEQFMPDVASIRMPCVLYRQEYKTPASVVRSQFAIAAGQLQSYCDRQAFNFRIQSLGAAYIKQFQTTIARKHIPAGVHPAGTLAVLPGINVHDELHLYVRDESAIASVQETTSTEVSRVSNSLGVPILFEFSEVKSWAEKA